MRSEASRAGPAGFAPAQLPDIMSPIDRGTGLPRKRCGSAGEVTYVILVYAKNSEPLQAFAKQRRLHFYLALSSATLLPSPLPGGASRLTPPFIP